MSCSPSSTDTPNVLLVVLDTVRARNLSLHGHTRETTPFLEEFAEQSTVYTNARSPAPWTFPSHTSMFTGLPAHEHRVNTKQSQFNGSTVHQWLSQQGYETGVFSENPFLSLLDAGLKNDFEHVHPTHDVLYEDGLDPRAYDVVGRQYGQFVKDALLGGHPIKSILNGVSAMAKSHPITKPVFGDRNSARYHASGFSDWHSSVDGPWAACINLMDAHAPYKPTEEFNRFATKDDLENPALTAENWGEYRNRNHTEDDIETIQRLYDGGILQADDAIRQVVNTLESRGELDNTLVIVTSDHGECFSDPHDVTGEDLFFHQSGLNESLLHVPLLVKFPGQTSGRREDGLASNLLYHDVVRNVVSNDPRNPDGFLTDELEVTLRYSTSDKSVHAVYTQDDESIRKYVGDDSGKVGYEITGLNSQTEIPIPSGYESRLDELLALPVEKQSDETAGEVSDDVAARLRDLGYSE